jgi:hypothetical protein
VGEIASPNSQVGRGGIMRDNIVGNRIMRIEGDGNSAVLTTALDPGARLDPGDRLLLGIKP